MSNNTTPSAIQTDYRGYKFRSRLEARWAVFLDAINANWRYEPEGYELPCGSRYLPDFFLYTSPREAEAHTFPGAGAFLEIKPIQPTERELLLCLELCALTHHNAILAVGLPGENFLHTINQYSGHRVGSGTDMLDITRDVAWAFSRYGESDGYYLTDEVQAIRAARGARFEFGEGRML